MPILRTLSLTSAVLLLCCACVAPSAPAVRQSYVRLEDGSLLHYRKVGEGPDVVLVPGESWLGYDLDALAPGRTLIFYDARGRGRSDAASELGLERDLADLDEVRRWFQLERFALMGFDYSAALVANYAARHPSRVTRLLLISPLPVRRDPYWDVYTRMQDSRMDPEAVKALEDARARRAKREMGQEEWSEAYRKAVLGAWVVDARVLERMRSPILVEPNDRPEWMHRQYKLLLASLDAWDWRELVGAITCPTLLVRGAEDPMPEESPREWVAAIPGAREIVLRGAARLPWVEQPAEFRSAAGTFLPSNGVEN